MELGVISRKSYLANLEKRDLGYVAPKKILNKDDLMKNMQKKRRNVSENDCTRDLKEGCCD